MKLNSNWKCSICGDNVDAHTYHDCKPVPLAKVKELEEEVERLRAALRCIASMRPDIHIDVLAKHALCEALYIADNALEE